MISLRKPASPWTAGRIPGMSAAGMLTFNSGPGRRSLSISSTTCATAAETEPCLRSPVDSIETATEGTPCKAPSSAAATVPEYVTSRPMLLPRLIPEKTRSGGVSRSSLRARLTQSVGVPFTT